MVKKWLVVPLSDVKVATVGNPRKNTKPVVVSAVINAIGTLLTITFSQTVKVGTGGYGGFALTTTGATPTLTYGGGSGSTVLTYTISRPILASEIVTLRYTQPSNGIENLFGTDVVSFSSKSVTNASLILPLPINVTPPFFSPSGNQAALTEITWNRGAWTNGATYDVYLKADGTVFSTITGTAAQTGTINLTALQVGQVITIGVIAYNSGGTPNSLTQTAGSNSVTVTGAAPSLTPVTPPAFTDPLILDQANTLIEAVWNHTPDSVIHNFYANGAPTPFRAANTGLVFTPHPPPHSDNLFEDDSIVMESVPTYLGTVFAAYRSVAKILQAAPSPPPAPNPPPSPSPPPSDLAALPYPVPTLMTPQSSPSYSIAGTITGSDAIVRLQQTVDPDGSGKIVYLHRIVRADMAIPGDIVAAQKIWKNQGYPLNPGIDYWFSFAVRGKSGEWANTHNPATADDECIVFETSTQSAAYSYSELAFTQKLSGSPPPQSAYFHSWQPTVDAPVTDPLGGIILGQLGIAMNASSWSKYIVHFRPGYLASHAPRLEIWVALNGSTTFIKTVDSTHINTYNHTINGATGEKSYPRIGLRHFSQTWNPAYTTIAAYFTHLYRGQGVDLYAQCVSVLQDLVYTPPAPSPSPPPASQLSPMIYPVPLDIAPQSGGMYDGVSTVTAASIIRMQKLVDPGGSGRTDIYLHRMVKSEFDAVSNWTRAEKVWIDFNSNPNYYLLPGNDYWFAFAVRPKSGEYPISTGSTDNNMLVWQVHSESTGNTQNDLGLYHDIGLNRSFFNRAWGSSSDAVTTDGSNKDWIGPYPQTDVWTKYIVHYRPGYITSHAPKTRVWQKIGSGPYQQIVNAIQDTDFNTYNWPSGSYSKIGFYKWKTTTWTPGVATIAAYFTNNYFGLGADRYNDAVASLAGL